MIPVARPEITSREHDYIKEVLDSRILARGPFTERLEDMFCHYFGVSFSVACANGTLGLYAVLQAMEWLSGDPDKHVVISDETFGATMNAVALCGERWTIESVSQYQNSPSLEPDIYIPCHIFGVPAKDFEEAEITSKFVLEDACEAIGAEYEGSWLGTIGDAGVFGFYPNKQICMGEGGMIITEDWNIYKMCRDIINQGRDDNEHYMLGINARMTEMQAAIGCAQMERIDEILYVRQAVAQDYINNLDADALKRRGIAVPTQRDSWFAFPLTGPLAELTSLKAHLANADIQSAIYFPESKPYPQFVHSRHLCIPFFNELSHEDTMTVCKELNKWAKK